MNFKGVIFDLDGVICHTDKFHYLAWKKVCDEYNLTFNEQINHRLRGVSRIESVELILNSNNKTMSDMDARLFAKEKNSYYLEYLQQLSPSDLSKDTEQTLLHLKSQDFKLAIGSSSKNALYILTQIGLKDFFDFVSDGNMIVYSKPNPEVFIKAADSIGLTPFDCLVVEDAMAGIDAAISGGFKCAAIGSDAISYEKGNFQLSLLSDLLMIL